MATRTGEGGSVNIGDLVKPSDEICKLWGDTSNWPKSGVIVSVAAGKDYPAFEVLWDHGRVEEEPDCDIEVMFKGELI
jgi:hypothetical protein